MHLKRILLNQTEKKITQDGDKFTDIIMYYIAERVLEYFEFDPSAPKARFINIYKMLSFFFFFLKQIFIPEQVQLLRVKAVFNRGVKHRQFYTQTYTKHT